MSDDDYGFEYSDDDQEEETVDLENRYYNAKGDLAEDVDAALSGFKEVVSMEEEKGEWGFKVRSGLHTPAGADNLVDWAGTHERPMHAHARCRNVGRHTSRW